MIEWQTCKFKILFSRKGLLVFLIESKTELAEVS